jgi:hypothetical protein
MKRNVTGHPASREVAGSLFGIALMSPGLAL